MTGQLFTTRDLPAHHETMLIVKVRPSGLPKSPLTIASTFSEKLAGSPGLLALGQLERAGLIKRVIPLAPKKDEEPILPAGVAFSSLAASLIRVPPEHTSMGTSVIELERDKDVPDLQAALAKDDAVEFVSRVPVRYLLRKRRSAPPKPKPGMIVTATPPAATTMWNLRRIGWAEARAQAGFKGATGVRVAVLDTGIDSGHPDLAGRVKRYTHAYPDVPTPSGKQDIVGHGTHVAGTIGALINNNVGINGICDAELHALKIFSDQTECFSLAAGFVYYVDPIMYRMALAECVDAAVNVVNLSIGGPGKPDPQEQELFKRLLARGTIIVAAMGNERRAGSPTSYPAAIPGVIAVGATNIDDSIADFSSRGDHIAVCAPGKAIWSTLPTYPGQFGFEAVLGPDGHKTEGKPFRRETNYDAWDGTSMASPHVAAAAALLIAKRGRLSAADVRDHLMKTADKVPEMGGASFDPDHGAGRLNLLAVLS